MGGRSPAAAPGAVGGASDDVAEPEGTAPAVNPACCGFVTYWMIVSSFGFGPSLHFTVTVSRRIDASNMSFSDG